MAKLLMTGEHEAVTIPGKVHGRQLLRIAELIQAMVAENGGWGFLHLEIRGGDIHRASKEVSELFSPDKLRSTA